MPLQSMSAIQLLFHLIISVDRSLDQLWKKRNKQQKTKRILFGFILFKINIHQITNGNKHIKRDTKRYQKPLKQRMQIFQYCQHSKINHNDCPENNFALSIKCCFYFLSSGSVYAFIFSDLLIFFRKMHQPYAARKHTESGDCHKNEIRNA